MTFLRDGEDCVNSNYRVMNCIVLSDYLIAEFLIYGAAGARLSLGLHWRQEDRT